MIAVDTNVLVYAHRAGLPNHVDALNWLNHLAGGAERWAIPVFCLGEFVRVVTHPRVLAPPSTVVEAVSAVEALLESPSLSVLSPGSRFAALFCESVREGDARGNLAFDAQIVALCREHGVRRLLTLDRDFKRFDGIGVLSVVTSPL